MVLLLGCPAALSTRSRSLSAAWSSNSLREQASDGGSFGAVRSGVEIPLVGVPVAPVSTALGWTGCAVFSLRVCAVDSYAVAWYKCYVRTDVLFLLKTLFFSGIPACSVS